MPLYVPNSRLQNAMLEMYIYIVEQVISKRGGCVLPVS